MLSSKQKTWLNHLSDEKKIQIFPYDSNCSELFLKVKEKVKKCLGKNTRVEHRGASSLGISGQDEIDVYIPVSPPNFNPLIPKMVEMFGKARSIYPMERVRFSTSVEGKKIDLFLINKEDSGWINGVKFENYLRKHPMDLRRYKKLKEDGNGLSVRDYYTGKNEFINEILEKCK